MSKTLELENIQEIPCLLLPLAEVTLLVPTVSVAEMAPMRPVDSLDNMPDWVIGIYEWRHTKVPVIDYEAVNGGRRVPINPQGRMAVLNNTGVNPEIPFIAVPTQGIPRMARVSVNDISENTEFAKKPFDLMLVRVGVEELAVPDISALESAYLNLL